MNADKKITSLVCISLAWNGCWKYQRYSGRSLTDELVGDRLSAKHIEMLRANPSAFAAEFESQEGIAES